MSATEERCQPIGSEVRVGFYCIGKTIGKGNSAIVKHARHSITKSEVAIKIIDKSMFENGSSLDKICREINILKFLKHANIIKLYQVMESCKFIYLVSEYAPNGEIFEYISKHGRFTEADAKIKFAQILNAVDHCHKMGIVHRDLKAENLLLDENFNVKLADFGFGNFFSNDSKLSTWCGSPPYAAPEIFEGRTYYGPEVDIWSLGVILYVLVCGMLPFDGSNLRIIRDRVVSGRFRIPFFMSMECERLVRKILVVDPKKRYTMQQIQQHKWIHDILSSTTSQSLEESFREQLVVTGRGISMNCHEIVLQKMEGAKISKEQVLKSLENRAYDNFTAIYELLMDKIAKNIKCHPLSRLEAAGLRRPSMISEQAIMSVRQQPPSLMGGMSPTETKPPGLAETREAVFSQTTDGVQLQEVVGPLCQLQQRICTDERSEEMVAGGNYAISTVTGTGVVVLSGSPVRSKLVRSARLGMAPALTRVKQLVSLPTQIASSSIDEGVETEADVDNNLSTSRNIIQLDQSSMTTSIISSTAAYNKVTQSPCKPSISIDSNIEIDLVGSDLSLSSPASWSTSSNVVIDGSTSGAIYQAVHGELESVQYEQAVDQQHATTMTSSIEKEAMTAAFHSGRRGSEGLAIKEEFIKPSTLLLKNRTCGVAELRKELVKLQNETMETMPQQSPVYNCNITENVIVCTKQKSLVRDQRSLEESLLSRNCPGSKILQPCCIKRTLPYNRQTHLISPMECPSNVPRPHSPLRGSIKRQLGPMRSVPHHQHYHYVYGQTSNMIPGHPFYGEHFSSASNSPTRGGRVYSTLSGSPMCLDQSNHQSLDSGCNPLINPQQHLVSNHEENISLHAANLMHDNSTFVNLNIPFNKNSIPVCHSNLLPNIIYNSPTRCPYNVQSSLSATSSTSSSPLPGASIHHMSSGDDVMTEESGKHINLQLCSSGHVLKTSIPIFDEKSGVSKDWVQSLMSKEKQMHVRDVEKLGENIDVDAFPDDISDVGKDIKNIASDECPNLEGGQDNKKHLERRMRFGLVQQQQVCGSEEEMITSLGNSPEDDPTKVCSTQAQEGS